MACSAGPYNVTVPLGLDLFAPIPEDNPITEERVALGRLLFFDPLLSIDGSTSCSSCHRPDQAFSDSVRFSRGVYGRTGRRNAPSILNVAYREAFFWDGRATTLEQQVLVPIQDTLEMALTLPILEARLHADAVYSRAFERAFGEPASSENVARAVASYLRTLRSANSDADRFRSHGDTAALTPLARRGFELFVGKGRCTSCHVGATLADAEFHNTGVAWRTGSVTDSGRFTISGTAQDVGAFKTPSLRNLALTAPYMHDGSLLTLTDVIDFYDRGGNRNPYLDPMIRPIGFSSDEKAALLAFLHSLSSHDGLTPFSH
jgi:cytochrome c peroxidase